VGGRAQFRLRGASSTRNLALVSCKARNQMLERKQLSPLQLHSPHVWLVGPASGRGTSKRSKGFPAPEARNLKPSCSTPCMRSTPRLLRITLNNLKGSIPHGELDVLQDLLGPVTRVKKKKKDVLTLFLKVASLSLEVRLQLHMGARI